MDESTSSNISAIITSLISTAAACGAIPDPVSATLISSSSAIIDRLINKSLLAVFNRNGTKRDCERLGVAYNVAAQTVEKNRKAGKSERTDDFFDARHGHFNRAEDLVAASLRYCIDDPESIKSVCYGRFIGNIPFCNYSHRTMIAMNKTISELTYDELCLIAAIYGCPHFHLDALETFLRSEGFIEIEVREFYVRILHLKTMGILAQTRYFHSESAIGEIYLSEMGHGLYSLMELNLLEPSDIAHHQSMISRFAGTVQH